MMSEDFSKRTIFSQWARGAVIALSLMVLVVALQFVLGLAVVLLEVLAVGMSQATGLGQATAEGVVGVFAFVGAFLFLPLLVFRVAFQLRQSLAQLLADDSISPGENATETPDATDTASRRG